MSKVITLPFTTFLDILWGYKDKATLGCLTHASLLAQIKETYSEQECHLEEIKGDKEMLIVIWRPLDWQTEYSRHLRAKQASENRVEQWNNRKASIEYIHSCLTNMLGEAMGMIATELASKIYDEHNSIAATQFGCDLTKIKGW